MCETEWIRFDSEICDGAYCRLSSAFEHFCRHGTADLPRTIFKLLTASPDDAGGGRHATFEAHGVVVRGRRAMNAGRANFFVTSIDIDPIEPDPARSRRVPDIRQAVLPLEFSGKES
jgi:hypothetical protein